MGLWNNGIISNRPAEGDVLFFPLTKSFFEIKFVEHQQPFYQLTNVPVYKLQCELFEYNNEEVSTGNTDVDSFELQFSTETWMDISGGSSRFALGEPIKQVLGDGEIHGKVLKYKLSDTGQLSVAVGGVTTTSGKFAKFRASTSDADKLVSRTTDVSWTITKVYDINEDEATNKTFIGNDQQAQNNAFEVEGNAALDFSETNPFGEPNQL